MSLSDEIWEAGDEALGNLELTLHVSEVKKAVKELKEYWCVCNLVADKKCNYCLKINEIFGPKLT